MLQVEQLRCEGLDQPLGIDARRPRLSWQLRSERRGARQVAYRLRAAGAPAQLDAGAGLLWDSGRVESDQSTYVPYGGPALASGQRIWWDVEVWDEAGRSARSAASWWEIGLLRRGDWRAGWVASGLVGGAWASAPAALMRRSFRLSAAPAQARLYITALGLYEARINGRRVGQDELTPGWTDYRTRVQYQVYDVADMLQAGENVLGAILGDGWYAGQIAWQGRQRYGERPLLLAQLEIVDAEGRRQRVLTDESWRWASGPILAGDLVQGESYDARLERPGWDAPGFDASAWGRAQRVAAPGAALSAMRGPAVRSHELIAPSEPPRSHRHHTFTRWTFNFGQNLVGRVRLRVSGPAGTTITIRHAEMLGPDGTIYTANLRSATQVDHYTLRGEGVEEYEPRFTFHGFQYVELDGLPSAPDADTLRAVVLHSATPPSGEFSCSEPLLNQLQHNIVWGQKGNFVDVPTDCPQRDERLGWTGDAQAFIRTATFNMDVAPFFRKWLRDLDDAQAPSGSFPSVAPDTGLVPDDGGPAWADAGIICPWTIWQRYGDLGALEEHYPAMQRFIAYLEQSSRGLIRCHPDDRFHCYGDWLALDDSGIVMGRTPHDLIGTAFFAHDARLMAEIAEALGRAADARRYRRLHERVREAFLSRYVTPDGLVAGQTQTGYVLALHFGLLPEARRATAAAELARDIRRRGVHLSTGFVGTPYLLHVLSEAGQLDLAYQLLLQRSWPSWLYPVTQGATTIWERWDGWTRERGFQDPGMNSFNHYAFGAVGDWMYATLAGLDTDPQAPGYRRLLLRPRPGGGISSARASYATPYGQALSSWQIDGAELVWEVVVPPNSGALVHVPCAEGAAVREGGRPASEAEGVVARGWADGAAIFEVGAGSYRFSAPLAR